MNRTAAPDTARCPAVLVCAPASGQGKTTVAAALARLHARRGRRVRAFKCGPDFIDPHWLRLATGALVDPLDLWLNGEADCAVRLANAARSADLIVIEGAMGLFDGDPSAADLAARFDLALLAVVDASAMAGTFGALVHGLRHYRDGLRWAGVLGNRVAGARHADMLRDALREPADWLGALPAAAEFALPERHLGLVLAGEIGDAAARLDAAADALAATPLGRWDEAALARLATDFGAPAPAAAMAPEHPAPWLAGRTVAIARDDAFCFLYDANLACLRELGADLSFFSPLAGDLLPRCDAVWLPGGYPELHARRLADNRGLRAGLAAHVERGAPLLAECGGMMSLFEQLTTADGEVHAMWGLLPGSVTMHRRLAAIGPQQLDLAGGVLRGHAFHHSTCATPLVPAAYCTRPATSARGEAIYRHRGIVANYFHAWFASAPRAVAALLGAPEAA